jgi:hypothetical protein
MRSWIMPHSRVSRNQNSFQGLHDVADNNGMTKASSSTSLAWPSSRRTWSTGSCPSTVPRIPWFTCRSVRSLGVSQSWPSRWVDAVVKCRRQQELIWLLDPVQAFGIALKLTIAGNNQLTHASTYLFGLTVLGCILVQMVGAAGHLESRQ